MFASLPLFERRIRERAYFLWLEEGCPAGRSDDFWQRACALERQATQEAEDRLLDEEGAESFPASDPPSHSGMGSIGPGGRYRCSRVA